MKVLVVGNGGREHAICWKLLQSPRIEQVFCVPGNGGTATLSRCQNVPLNVNDFPAMAELAHREGISLVVVGPEVPLANGITDYLQSQGLMVFGPTRVGAQIEASKAWAKTLMQEAGIPTAHATVFTQASAAKSYVKEHGAPIVIKADGLAAGKGVTVATSLNQAVEAIDAIFQGQFGLDAAKFVVVEECLVGQEVSVLALTDGVTICPLLPAQDHKRIGEGDTGENTGGMGAYAPAPIATPELMARVQTEVLDRAIAALKAQGIDYRGVLYAGLMVSPDGDYKVLEFNCRFGDPETQVILPMLDTPLEDLLLACVQRTLSAVPIRWKSGAAATVVASSGGYPGHYDKGKVIHGIADAEAQGAVVFHAGTQLQDEDLLTDGGRVLNVTGVGADFAAALGQAYTGIQNIYFEDIYYRRDIGYRVIGER
ncbi:phosphoribosylamine--glycine ligase [Calothrix sp. 336/3]|uniref:phosphoribosylamine--glycine ligase n=1 Tax=Calothrix sp. 336/3 TaxID=1337936 RepID=UPI0004E45DC9|nr:phosphoribosylamine--glycine ligase [Calothrix sp. 336/3]AKG24472.1 phosphoribosylamine--glycine ligase [Calothrix sp. 336/3]